MILTLLDLYVTPFILALSLMCFVYGVIRFYVNGPGDEDLREYGRSAFLWAALLAFFGVVLVGVTVGVRLLTAELAERRAQVETETDVTSKPATLPVPNVPTIRSVPDSTEE